MINCSKSPLQSWFAAERILSKPYISSIPIDLCFRGVFTLINERLKNQWLLMLFLDIIVCLFIRNDENEMMLNNEKEILLLVFHLSFILFFNYLIVVSLFRIDIVLGVSYPLLPFTDLFAFIFLCVLHLNDSYSFIKWMKKSLCFLYIMQTNFAKYSIFGSCFMFFNQGHQECSFQQTICLTYCKHRK